MLQQNLEVRSIMKRTFILRYPILKETVWKQWEATNARASTTRDISRSILFYLLSRATSCSHDASLSNEDDARGKTNLYLHFFVFWEFGWVHQNKWKHTIRKTSHGLHVCLWGQVWSHVPDVIRFGAMEGSFMPSKLVDGKHDHVCFFVTTQQKLKDVGFRIVVLYGMNSWICVNDLNKGQPFGGPNCIAFTAGNSNCRCWRLSRCG